MPDPQRVHERSEQVREFGDILDRLIRHARAAARAEEPLHVECLDCQTLRLLTRAVGFGRQLIDCDA